jgi:hypothetical protein
MGRRLVQYRGGVVPEEQAIAQSRYCEVQVYASTRLVTMRLEKLRTHVNSLFGRTGRVRYN